MKAYYQWTESGELELCELEVCQATHKLDCYHCLESINPDDKYIKLTSLEDGDTYHLEVGCARKSIYPKDGIVDWTSLLNDAVQNP